MNISARIALRYLTADNKNNFTKIASLLSVIGLSFGVASLLITIFILNGFENVISRKITNFDGHIQIKHFLNKPISQDFSLFDSLKSEFNNQLFVDRYLQKPAVIRVGNANEGIMMLGLEKKNHFPFEQISIIGDSRLSENKIIIGKDLAKKMGLNIGSNIAIMDIATIDNRKNTIAQFTIAGLYSSGMKDFDDSMLFVDLDRLQAFSKLENFISGLIIRLENIKDINIVNKYLNRKLEYPYDHITWKDKNSALYKWMKVQRLPILIIFGLIAFVGIVNIISATAMIIIDKTNQIGLLLSLGMKKFDIRRIFLFHGIFVGSLGAFLGVIISLVLAFLQNNFKIISISSDVYFMDYLPVDPDFLSILIIFMLSILFSVLSIFWPIKKINEIEPSNALKY